MFHIFEWATKEYKNQSYGAGLCVSLRQKIVPRPTLQTLEIFPRIQLPGIQNCHEIRKDPALQVRRVSRRFTPG